MGKPEAFNTKLGRMDKDAQAFIKKRVNAAIKLGWKRIEFWCEDGETPSIFDLCGVNPKGEFDFIDAVEDSVSGENV